MNVNWNKALVMGLLILAPWMAQAQNPEFEKDVDEQMEEPLAGPRGPRAVFVDYGWTMILPGGESDSLQNEGASNNFWYGVMLHRNFNKVLGGGIEIAYTRNSFHIAQDTLNPMVGQVLNDRQRFIQNGIGTMLYLRLQISNKGNNLGRYVDLGGYADLTLSERLYSKNEVDPAQNAGVEIIKVDQKKLDYTNNYNYGVYARVGFGALSLVGRYRLSDVFTASDNINAGVKMTEFERLSVGISLTIFPNP